MKLDPDIVRELLLRVEKEHDSPDWRLPIGNKEDYLLFYAASKLIEAKFIKAETIDIPGPGTEPEEEYWVIVELTYAGHELLNTIRDPAIWKATKEGAKKVGASSLGVLLEVAKAIVKSKLEDHGLALD